MSNQLSSGSFFRFPQRTKRIEGGRRVGKTYKLAKIVIADLLQGKNVLVILPTVPMLRYFQDECKTIAEDIAPSPLSFDKMKTYVFQMNAWDKFDDMKVYQTIVFVDGPDDDRNPMFNGHKYAFNIGPNVWSLLDWHANHCETDGFGKPDFYVACNEWNLKREEAQIWILDFARIDASRHPLNILEKLKELSTFDPDVAALCASKLKASVI